MPLPDLAVKHMTESAKSLKKKGLRFHIIAGKDGTPGWIVIDVAGKAAAKGNKMLRAARADGNYLPAKSAVGAVEVVNRIPYFLVETSSLTGLEKKLRSTWPPLLGETKALKGLVTVLKRAKVFDSESAIAEFRASQEAGSITDAADYGDELSREELLEIFGNPEEAAEVSSMAGHASELDTLLRSSDGGGDKAEEMAAQLLRDALAETDDADLLDGLDDQVGEMVRIILAHEASSGAPLSPDEPLPVTVTLQSLAAAYAQLLRDLSTLENLNEQVVQYNEDLDALEATLLDPVSESDSSAVAKRAADSQTYTELLDLYNHTLGQAEGLNARLQKSSAKLKIDLKNLQ